MDPDLERSVREARERVAELDASISTLNDQIGETKAKNKWMVGEKYAPLAADCARLAHLASITQHERDELADFLAEMDADTIQKAVKGLGTDKSMLVYVLCQRTKLQLQAVARAFRAKYGADLQERLDSELSGDLGYFVRALLTPDVEYDVALLGRAVDGWGQGDEELIEFLGTRSPLEMKRALHAYAAAHGAIEDKLRGSAGGARKAFLYACLTESRVEAVAADDAAAEAAAAELSAAGLGGGQWTGEDAAILPRLVATAADVQTAAIARAFQRSTGTSLLEAAKAADEELAAALKCRLMTQPQLLAEGLRRAFHGWGTDERALARIFARHSLRELKEVGQAYQQAYGVTLVDDLQAELGGPFEKHFRAAMLQRLTGVSPSGAGEDEPQLDGPHEGKQLEGFATSELGTRFDTYEEAARACVHPSSSAAGVTRLGAEGPFTLRLSNQLQDSSQGEISWLR